MSEDSQLLIRFLSIYGAQIGLAIIFALNFFYFSRVYARRFLSKWSISWAGLIILNLGMMFASLNEFSSLSAEVKLLGTLAHLTGGLIQASFLGLGTYELVKHTYIKKKYSAYVATLAVVLATIMAFLYAFDPESYTPRYIIRIGVRSLKVGLVYKVCGFFAIYSRRFGLDSYGKKLFGIALISYGLAQASYFLTVVLAVYGYDVSTVLSVYGIVDLFLVTVIGLGMVMWLLEDERLKLESTNADLDRFLYSTSHDLRAPIASVLGLTHVAKLESNHDQLLHYFDMIEERVKKLDEVISDILAYSKNSKSAVSKDKVDFNLLLEEVVSDLKFNKGASNIRLIYEKNPENYTICDAAQLKIILNNLLANAVKYHDLNKTDPFIEVVFQKVNNQVSITVTDNGNGIAEEHQEKIFDMFYRASTDSDGSGLGLFIVKEATKKIGGEIELSSALGNGSSFHLIYEESA